MKLKSLICEKVLSLYISYNYWGFIFCYDENKNSIGRTGAGATIFMVGKKNDLINEVSANTKYIRFCLYNSSNINGTIETLSKAESQLEVGETATQYEPYIPSVKMLADEVSAQNESLGGLSFSASGTTLTITDGTNTWTLNANS